MLRMGRSRIGSGPTERAVMQMAILYDASAEMLDTSAWLHPPLIGIGGSLTASPLPHHRAYGSVPRRFGWVEWSMRGPVLEVRASRSRR